MVQSGLFPVSPQQRKIIGRRPLAAGKYKVMQI